MSLKPTVKKEMSHKRKEGFSWLAFCQLESEHTGRAAPRCPALSKDLWIPSINNFLGN